MRLGGAIGGVTAAVKGEDVMQGVLNGAADGFMNGAITGAITGGMQGAASFMKSSKMMGSLDDASHFSKKVKTTKGCPKDCFAAGTLVKTEEGYKAIEEIEVGDKVWSWDEATGEQALKTVVQLFRNEKDVLVHIDAAGEQIQTTLGHPFYVAGKGWVKAGELKSGDVLKLYDGKEAEINSISIKESKPVITYNFEVEDSHTYYVTQSDVLCHNACSNIQTGGTKDFSIHKSRRAAYRAARRDAGVLHQSPTKVGPAYNKQGHMMPGKTYTFGDQQILWHSAGHPEYGMTRHFNYNGWHYFY